MTRACERSERVQKIAAGCERLNPNGGAVALGHSFGDSGTRCMLTLATELRERYLRYGAIGVTARLGSA